MVSLTITSIVSWALLGAFGSAMAFLASGLVVLAVLRAVAILVSNHASSSARSRSWSSLILFPSLVDSPRGRGRQSAGFRADPSSAVWTSAGMEDGAHGGARRSAASRGGFSARPPRAGEDRERRNGAAGLRCPGHADSALGGRQTARFGTHDQQHPPLGAHTRRTRSRDRQLDGKSPSCERSGPDAWRRSIAGRRIHSSPTRCRIRMGPVSGGSNRQPMGNQPRRRRRILVRAGASTQALTV